MAKTTAAPTELARRTVSTAAHLQDFSITGLGPDFKSATATLHSGLQRADIQLVTSVAISFNSRTDGSANLNGGEIPTINDGSWSLIGSPDTIFKRRAVRLPKTRLIRSNGA
jgi:hypothetical protein|tara:strand:- start:3697 stop:4032 length:336 start_codon:yes stop_codon:yes gene_type:complete